MVRGLETKSYKKWLKEFDVVSLKKRRLKGDMIAIFQYMKGYHREKGIDLFTRVLKAKTKITDRRFTVSNPHLN